MIFLHRDQKTSGYSWTYEKKISMVGCSIDKRQKSRGTVKIRFTE